MDQCPSSCHISSRSAKQCTRKALQRISPTCEFWHPRAIPWAKVHQSWNWCTARPDLSMCQSLSHSGNLGTRYLLSNFVDFVDRVTDTAHAVWILKTPAKRLLFQDNLGKLAPERLNQSGFQWSKRWRSGSVISWTICKPFASYSRQITTPAAHHSMFSRPGALSDVLPTVLKHWRQTVRAANINKSLKSLATY